MFIVGGASAGFTLAFLAAVRRRRPGRRLEPGYPCYRNTLLALGIEPVRDPGRARHAVGADAGACSTPPAHLDGLVIASPSNPTGTVLTQRPLADDHRVRARANGVAAGRRRDLPRHHRTAGPAPTVLDAHAATPSWSTASRSTFDDRLAPRLDRRAADTLHRRRRAAAAEPLHLRAARLAGRRRSPRSTRPTSSTGTSHRYRANRTAADRRARRRRASPTSPTPTARSTSTPTSATSSTDGRHRLAGAVPSLARRGRRRRHARASTSTSPAATIRPLLVRRAREPTCAEAHGERLQTDRRAVTRPTTAPLAGLRVIDLSTVLAGPNCARYLADFGADVIKVERPDGGDSLRNMAWRDPRDGEGLWWKMVNRNKRTDRARPEGRRRRGGASCGWSPGPTCSSRTSGRARSNGSASGPTCCSASNPALVITRVTGFGQDRPVRRAPGLRHDRRGDVGARRDQRRARRPTAAAADRPHRRGHRTGRRVRHDGGAAQRGRPGGRRQPAGEHVPADGPAGVALRAHRRAAGAARRRAAVHGAAGHVPVRRRELGRPVGVERLGGGTRAAPARRRRRPAVRHVRRSDGPPRRTRGVMADWCRRRTQRRGDRRVHRGRGGDRPGAWTWPTSPPTRTTRPATRSSTLDGTPMQGLIAKLSATPGALRWQGRALDADGDEIREKGWDAMTAHPRATWPAALRRGRAVVDREGRRTRRRRRLRHLPAAPRQPAQGRVQRARDLRERQARHRRVRRRGGQPQRRRSPTTARPGSWATRTRRASTSSGCYTDWRHAVRARSGEPDDGVLAAPPGALARRTPSAATATE